MSLLLQGDFFRTSNFQDFQSPITFFLHNLESSNFLRRCEQIERKTPSKNILEFLKHFSSRSHHKLFFGPPCIYRYLSIHLSIHLFIYQTIYLSIYLSINLFIYPSIYLSMYLSINLFILAVCIEMLYLYFVVMINCTYNVFLSAFSIYVQYCKIYLM